MQKAIIKGLCKIITKQIEKEDLGYEMGCLISVEFTPAPDMISVYEEAKRLCDKFKLDFHEFMKGLWDMAKKERSYSTGLYEYVFGCIKEGECNGNCINHRKKIGKYW